MKEIFYKDIVTSGMLGKKISKNFKRLSESDYDEKNCFKPQDYSWHGDWEGRTILAQTSLWQATNYQPESLKKIIDLLKEKTNTHSYFGPILDLLQINEQQLAGNSWFLRGLCKYYQMTSDPIILNYIKEITNNLYIPLLKVMHEYPLTAFIKGEGEKSGEIIEKAGVFLLSSDIGCLFISLDGLTDAYSITQDSRIYELIEVLIDIYMKIDRISNNFQTHATLTAARGIVNFYYQTGNKKYLEYANIIFNQYIDSGMTLSYSNYNWFNRPEWTESCAVIDSFILAKQFYKITRNPKYLDLSHKIYYNSLNFAQRITGGFGCDICVTESSQELMADTQIFYEAYWCCTMRGGEGLLEISTSQYFLEGRNIWITLFNDNSLNTNNGKLVIKQKTSYPYIGKVSLNIEKIEEDSKITIYKPDNCSNFKVNIPFKEDEKYIYVENLKNGLEINIDFDLPLTAICEGNVTRYFKGEMMYGEVEKAFLIQLDKEAIYAEKHGDKVLIPIIDMTDVHQKLAEQIRQKVLFLNELNI